MEVRTNINNKKELEEVVENLEGVSFSGSRELGAAVGEVTNSKKGFLQKLLSFLIKKGFPFPQK